MKIYYCLSFRKLLESSTCLISWRPFTWGWNDWNLTLRLWESVRWSKGFFQSEHWQIAQAAVQRQPQSGVVSYYVGNIELDTGSMPEPHRHDGIGCPTRIVQLYPVPRHPKYSIFVVVVNATPHWQIPHRGEEMLPNIWLAWHKSSYNSLLLKASWVELANDPSQWYYSCRNRLGSLPPTYSRPRMLSWPRNFQLYQHEVGN